MTGAVYNEIDPFAADWLEALIREGHIARGTVDRRSIRELAPADAVGAVQFHAFAGIAGWSLALRLAGWPDGARVWTGSCPCQPFSTAGKRRGTADDRHLWPEWFRLIRECRPPVVFGEQVASPDGRTWLAAVRADLEGVGYRVGAADLCAAGVGAPHIRQRLYFVAVASGGRRMEGIADRRGSGAGDPAEADGGRPADHGDARRRANAERWPAERQRYDVAGAAPRGCGEAWEQRIRDDARDGLAVDRMGDAGGARLAGRPGERCDDGAERQAAERASGATDPWSDAEWIPCRDRKARPAQPGAFPLAHGVPGRVGRLRAYGNAIVPAVAATFIRAVMLTFGDVPAGGQPVPGEGER